jgi:hypothetical protein
MLCGTTAQMYATFGAGSTTCGTVTFDDVPKSCSAVAVAFGAPAPDCTVAAIAFGQTYQSVCEAKENCGYTAGATDVGVTIRSDVLPTTTGHKWHIHADSLSDLNDCATAGGHYDPTGVEIDGYSCDPAAPGACYTGDLSGKFGAASATTVGAFTDSVLTLAELASKSLVVHGADGAGARIGCGRIVAGTPPAAAEAVAMLAGGSVSGYVHFQEACGGGVSLTAMLTSSSGSTGHKWHVHADALSDVDACATAGGHYDPTGVAIDGYSCDPAAPGACYTGDLSGKFGAVAADGVAVKFVDSTITMEQLLSGKSIVIHAADGSGARVGCGLIVAGPPGMTQIPDVVVGGCAGTQHGCCADPPTTSKADAAGSNCATADAPGSSDPTDDTPKASAASTLGADLFATVLACTLAVM